MRKTALFLFGAILVIVAGLASGADVDSTDCGAGVVQIGDSQDDVLLKCGSPSYTVGDAWVYDLELSESLKVIHFNEGSVFQDEVTRIEEVERGELGPGDPP